MCSGVYQDIQGVSWCVPRHVMHIKAYKLCSGIYQGNLGVHKEMWCVPRHVGFVVVCIKACSRVCSNDKRCVVVYTSHVMCVMVCTKACKVCNGVYEGI